MNWRARCSYDQNSSLHHKIISRNVAVILLNPHCELYTDSCLCQALGLPAFEPHHMVTERVLHAGQHDLQLPWDENKGLYLTLVRPSPTGVAVEAGSRTSEDADADTDADGSGAVCELKRSSTSSLSGSGLAAFEFVGSSSDDYDDDDGGDDEN